MVGDGAGVAGVPESLDERGQGGIGAALKVEHASASCEETSDGGAAGGGPLALRWGDCRTIEEETDRGLS